MSTNAISNLLIDLIWAACEPESETGNLADAVGLRDVRSYDEAGVMTQDEGFVLRTAAGHEFQVTVVRSR